jgi:hypothetical protein
MMMNAYALNDNACLTPRGVTANIRQSVDKCREFLSNDIAENSRIPDLIYSIALHYSLF